MENLTFELPGSVEPPKSQSLLEAKSVEAEIKSHLGARNIWEPRNPGATSGVWMWNVMKTCIYYHIFRRYELHLVGKLGNWRLLIFWVRSWVDSSMDFMSFHPSTTRFRGFKHVHFHLHLDGDPDRYVLRGRSSISHQKDQSYFEHQN